MNNIFASFLNPAFVQASGWGFVYGWSVRAFISIVLLLIGVVLARRISQAVRAALFGLTKRDVVANSPVASVFDSITVLSGTGLVSGVTYWAVLLLFISFAGEVLGLTFFSQIVHLIVSYVPNLLSAAIVLALGMLVAGITEKVVKQYFKRFAPQQAVLAGTLSSSLIMMIFVLMAVSELGIASNFIVILFAGLVLGLALAFGIAVGFGAKDLVADSLHSMVNEEKGRRNLHESKSTK
jgi:hypothetical protein